MYLVTLLFSYLTIFVNILTGFILFPLILENLGYKALGVFGLLFSLKSLLDIGIGWISSSIVKLLIKYRLQKASIYSLSRILNFSFGICFVIFFYIYSYIFEKEYSLEFLLFGISSFFAFLSTPYFEYLISELRQGEVSFFRFLQQLLSFIFSISFFFAFPSLASIFCGFLFANFMSLALSKWYFNKNFGVIFNLNVKYAVFILKRIFSKELSIFINGLLTISILNLDVVLISILYGKESAGVYLIIFKIPNTLIMLGWRISEPFQAIVAKEIQKNKKKIFSDFKRLEKWVILIGMLFSLGYLTFGELLLDVWIGKDNVPDVRCMYVVPSLVVFLSILQRLYMSVNFLTKGLNRVNILEFIELTFKVAFTIFMFEVFGELAPIVGWATSLLLTIIFYRLNALRVLREGF